MSTSPRFSMPFYDDADQNARRTVNWREVAKSLNEIRDDVEQMIFSQVYS